MAGRSAPGPPVQTKPIPAPLQRERDIESESCRHDCSQQKAHRLGRPSLHVAVLWFRWILMAKVFRVVQGCRSLLASVSISKCLYWQMLGSKAAWDLH